MSAISNLPILILGYNRFEKFNRCIRTVQKQGIKKVYVSIDGPKNDYDLSVQKRIMDFCSNDNLGMNINIKSLKKNYGCRNAPIKGISWFFKENKFGVVLEDDVLVSKKCMELFSSLLEENFSNKNFMSISSFNEFTNNKIESLYSASVFRSWGWASWADRWQMHLELSRKIRNLSIWQIYNLLPKEFRLIETAEIIKSSQLNLLDAWDYEFNFSHIVNNKKSLTIGGINNYVYGFDDSATHTVNIENIGINFELFCEREIDTTKILKIGRDKDIATLAKCGFPKTINKNILHLIKDIVKSKFYSLIFYLRIIKKIMYKNF